MKLKRFLCPESGRQEQVSYPYNGSGEAPADYGVVAPSLWNKGLPQKYKQQVQKKD